MALVGCCVSPTVEETVYLVRALAIHGSVKPILGCVLNKTLEDRIQIALKLTAFCVVKAAVAKVWLCVANMGMKSNDEGWSNDEYVE